MCAAERRTWKPVTTRDRSYGASVPKFEIVGVQRNENPRLWAEYYGVREQIRASIEASGGCDRCEAKTSSLAAGMPEARH